MGQPLSGPELPSRGPAVAVIVIGIIIATVLAAVSFLIAMFSGSGLEQLLDAGSPVSSGSSVSVDDSGTYIVKSTDGSDLSCRLEAADGSALELQAVAGDSTIVMGSGITPGDYTLQCTGGGTTLVGMTGATMDAIGTSVFKALAWATAVGVAGIVITVVGIVMLVRVNGKRREVQRNRWRGGPTQRV